MVTEELRKQFAQYIRATIINNQFLKKEFGNVNPSEGNIQKFIDKLKSPPSIGVSAKAVWNLLREKGVPTETSLNYTAYIFNIKPNNIDDFNKDLFNGKITEKDLTISIDTNFEHQRYNFSEHLDKLIPTKLEEPLKKVKHIGVLDGSFLISKSRLKQFSLYFDEFVVIDIDRWEKFGEKIETAYFNQKNRKELDWLIEKEIIKLDSFPYGADLVQNDLYRRDFQKLQKLLEFKEGVLPENGARTEKEQRKIAAFLHKYSILKSRLQSTYLNTHYANIACPIIDNLDDLSVDLIGMPKEHVLNVLIKNIPIPVNATPWEQIDEFKKDPDSKDKFSRISNWLSKISTKEVKTNEMYQEIDYLLNEYEKHLNFYKMKYENSSLLTPILMDDEAFQSLNNITQKNKNKFSWTIEDISLFEAEAKIPGRELAYIVKAKEVFG